MKKPRKVQPAKPGQLKAVYGKAETYDQPSIVYAWGAEGACSGDGRVLSSFFEEPRIVHAGFEYKTYPSLVEELTSRGYDITTFRFTIEKKK